MTRRLGAERLPFDRTDPQALGGRSPGALLGTGLDDFALYTALREARRQLVAVAANYLVSWPFNPSLVDFSVAVPLTNQRAILVPQLVPAGQAIDGVAWVQQVAGVYTAVNSNQVGAYTFDGATFTRVAVSASNGNLWKPAAGYQVAAFTGQLAAGASDRLLWAAGVWNESAVTTVPTVLGLQAAGGGIGQVSPGLGGFSFQADAPGNLNLPATQAVGGVVVTDTNHHWLAFYRNYT